MPPVTARSIVLAAALFALAPPAGAATANSVLDDDFSLVREQMTVTAANKRPQPVSEVPSAVSVITAAEIHAHGYRTLGEVLQWVRGLYTRYDRNYTYLGVRGLQRPGDYNNRVLLTVDGHTINSPIYGDAVFGAEFGLDLERVERVEVVRGPGSTLYGSNAVLAVVNVVTRSPRATPALQAELRAGGAGERRLYAAVATPRGDRPQFALSISADDVDGAEWNYPEFAPLGPGAASRRTDAERARALLGSLVWRDLRLSVKVNERIKHVPTGAYGTIFGDPTTRTSDGHDYVELSSTHRPGPAVEWTTRGYWDASRYWGVYAYDASPGVLIQRDLGYSDLFGAESRAHWRPTARQVVTLGVEGRWVTRALQYTIDLDPAQVHHWSNSRNRQFGAYLQDEWTATGGARLTAGVRLDAYADYGTVASPRVDLSVPAGSGRVWKLMAGSAFRAPVPFETAYTVDGQVANPDLLPERVSNAEAGLVQRLGRATLTLSAYRNVIRDLVDVVELDTLGTWMFSNRGRMRGTGVEAELEWIGPRGTRARADLSSQRSVDVASGVDLTNSPRWNAHLVFTHPRIAGPVFGGFGVRWLSSRTTMAGAGLPSYAAADARVGVSAQRGFEAAIECRNLLDATYAAPGAPEHVQDAILQDGRTLHFTLGWRLTGR